MRLSKKQAWYLTRTVLIPICRQPQTGKHQTPIMKMQSSTNGPAPHHIDDKRSVTTLNFISYAGAQKRRRNLLDCSDYHALLRNAVAGDVFPASESVHVLSATINHRQAGIIIADDLDFKQMVQAIEEDDCWKEVGGRCQVRIERYKQKEYIKAEH